MNWKINAYCDKGHISTVYVALDTTGFVIAAPEECETCTSQENQLPWRERRRKARHEKKAIRQWRRELKKLG